MFSKVSLSKIFLSGTAEKVIRSLSNIFFKFFSCLKTKVINFVIGSFQFTIFPWRFYMQEKLVDILTSNLTSLEFLGEPTELWDSLTIDMVLKKLDSDLVKDCHKESCGFLIFFKFEDSIWNGINRCWRKIFKENECGITVGNATIASHQAGRERRSVESSDSLPGTYKKILQILPQSVGNSTQILDYNNGNERGLWILNAEICKE